MNKLMSNKFNFLHMR